MAWQIKLEAKARRELDKLDIRSKDIITNYLKKKVQISSHPRVLGKPLSGTLKHLWRYRVGDFRLICQIKDNELIVLVVKIAHRKEVYN